MKLSELLRLPEGFADRDVDSIAWDTRKLNPGALFFAMPGFKTDGGLFIQEAFDKGAAAVVCGEDVDDSRCIHVHDPRAALAEASAVWFGHPADQMTLIGVTGTNGKTTTTYLLKEILERTQNAVVGLIGTNQNIIGSTAYEAQRTTPESYELQELFAQMRDAGCTHVVMEVSSHALALRRVHGLHFACGVFSNLTEDHLDFHHTMEEYQAAKGLLFRQCGVGVVNLDDPAGRAYAKEAACPMFTYSENKAEADLTAKNLRLLPDRVEFEALSATELCRVVLPIPGGFSVYNALAALGCCVALGLPLESCAAALKEVHGVKGRVEVVPTPTDYTVLIDYAHTPDALENVLNTVRGFTKGRVICVFGCGGDRDRAKRPIMGAIGARLADIPVVTSDNPRTEDPAAIVAEVLSGFRPADPKPVVEVDRPTAIRKALSLARAGDTVVLAGKGHETYQEVNGEKRHMDEREIVADYFNKQ